MKRMTIHSIIIFKPTAFWNISELAIKMLFALVRNSAKVQETEFTVPAPRRKLEWCQSKTDCILALLKRSAGYLTRESPKENLVETWIAK